MSINKHIMLIIGILLLGIGIGLLVIPGAPIIEPAIFSDLVIYPLIGLGSSLTVYALSGRRGCLWIAVFLTVLWVPLYIINGYQLSPLTSLLVPMILLLLAFYGMKKYRIWMHILLIVLIVFITFTIFYLNEQTFYMRKDISDNPIRDEINIKRGWSYCGEFLIDPTPGIHVISWNKTLKGNESLACYFKVKIKGDRVAYIIYTFQTKYINHKYDMIGFSHYDDIEFTTQHVKGIKEPFSDHKGLYVADTGTMSTSSTVLDRADVYISFKPGFAEPEVLQQAEFEVMWKLEINILWLV